MINSKHSKVKRSMPGSQNTGSGLGFASEAMYDLAIRFVAFPILIIKFDIWHVLHFNFVR